MNDTIEFTCPHCMHSMQIHESIRTWTCQMCGKPSTVTVEDVALEATGVEEVVKESWSLPVNNNPYASPAASANPSPESLGTENLQNGPSGLGGWLILVAIRVVAQPFRLGAELLQIFAPIFRDGTWEILTTPGSDQYHPLWAGFIIFEILGNLGFLIAGCALVFLFFSKSRLFPKTFIAYLLINLCMLILDAWLGSFVITDEPMFDPDTTKALFTTLMGVVIFVPYMMFSKRVRNTFV
jgi:hypothetical protein